MSARDLARRRAAPLLLGALVAAMVAGRPVVVLTSIAVAAVAAAACGARRPAARWWAMLGVSSTVSVTLNAYLTPGAPLPWPVLFGQAATREGAWQGLQLGLRLVGAAVALHGLGAAWPGERAADELAVRLRGLERVGIPVARVRALVGLALRFAPLLGDEARRIAALQDHRAGRAPRTALERLARLRAIAIPSLVSALERADRVALGLEARHYRLRAPVRTPAAGWGWRGAGWALAGVGLLWR